MDVIKDITGWQKDLEAMYKDGRHASVFRNNKRCGIVDRVQEGIRPKTPLSHLKTYVDTLLAHNELRPALEAYMLRTLLDPFEEETEPVLDHSDNTKFPHAAQQLLNKFKIWYIVKQDMCPGFSMTECHVVAGSLIAQGIKSAFDPGSDLGRKLINHRLGIPKG